jgi:hypothetical protein
VAHDRLEASGLAAADLLMRRQRGLLGQLRDRQTALLARARSDLAAGMIDRTAVDREEQVGDQLALEATELDRAIAEAGVRRRHNRVALQALRASTEGGAAPLLGTMPEIAAGDEHTARIDVELERLRAEARGHRALRAAAIGSTTAQRALLAELEARPVYRAMKVATDVAFVPYDQLSGVHPGADVVACVWGVFACHVVGHITERIPGEVATQDPWGALARGEYVVLVLDDPDAIQQRVLRVRS